jgi:hypothetical protein
MPTITVNISKQGEATVRGEGFQGNQCLQSMKPLEEALGPQSGSREMHPQDTQQISRVVQ